MCSNLPYAIDRSELQRGSVPVLQNVPIDEKNEKKAMVKENK